MQILRIEPSELDFVPCCPKCGKRQNPESSIYCEHVSFVFLPRHEFEYISSDFQPTADHLRSLIEKNQALEMDELLMTLPDSGQSFIMEVSTQGMTCGPSSLYVFYGFNLET